MRSRQCGSSSNFRRPPLTGRRPFSSLQEDPDEAAREVGRDLPERALAARAGGAFDLELVAEKVVVLLQRLDQQEVDRKPYGPAPVRVAAEERRGRLAGLVVEHEALAVEREDERIGRVPLRQRANAVRAEEPVLVEHVRQDAPELVRIDEREAQPLLDAAMREVGEAGRADPCGTRGTIGGATRSRGTGAGCRARRPRSRAGGSGPRPCCARIGKQRPSGSFSAS